MASEQLPLGLGSVTTAQSLTLFRYTDYDVPFWVRPNRRSGRWHRRGDPPTQYWSMTPEAAWAELIRAEDLRSEQELDLIRMPVWACRFPSARLVDLGDDDTRRRLSVSLACLVSDDWAASQDLGRRLRTDHPGVIAPCAALEQHWNVTLFGARRQIDWRDRPLLARAIPAAIVAIGRPPVGLVDRVQRPRAASDRPRLF